MASTSRFEHTLGWLLACLIGASVACDDDTAADTGADTAAEHDHAAHAEAAGSEAQEDHDHEHSTAVGPDTNAECPDDSALTYASFGEKFMEDYCLRCHGETVSGDDRHGAPEDHNFTDIIDIRVFTDHIDQYAGAGPDATNEMMPPSDPKPSMEEREQLAEWLACGAPE